MNWTDDLRGAGLDPVRDWRVWQRIGAFMEYRAGLIEEPEYRRLRKLLALPSLTLAAFERLHDAVYVAPR